eukprot:1913751-Rhodomonas_salina.2
MFTWPFLVASQLLSFAEIARFLSLFSGAPVRRGQSQWGIIPSTYLCYFFPAFHSSLPAIAARSLIVAWPLFQPAPKAGFVCPPRPFATTLPTRHLSFCGWHVVALIAPAMMQLCSVQGGQSPDPR